MADLASTHLALRVCRKLRKTLHRNGRMIVISSMPKSGSTFLARTVAEVTGYEHTYLAYAYGNAEQELYLPSVIDAYGKGTVTQQHFKANQHNLEILQDYAIRPIILVRDIFDSIVSVRDHLAQERLDNLPGVHVDPAFLALEPDQQIDFVTDMVAPWYMAYFVSWCTAEAAGVPFLWLSYEEAIADWPAAVTRVLHYSGLSRPEADISRAVDVTARKPRQYTRLNRGVAGRGNATLSACQRERVLRLARHYRSVDFSRIGIRDTSAAPVRA